MNHPITWSEYITVRLLISAACIVLILIVSTVLAIVRWHEDCHVNDESDRKQPGNILGL
jgi:hypothetical protein